MKIASRSTVVPTLLLIVCFAIGASGAGGHAILGQQSQTDTSGSAEARDFFNSGRINMEQGNPRAALDAFEHAVAKDPNFALGWSAAGEVHFGLNDREQGVEEMQRALALDPRQRAFYVSLATAFMFMKREEEALKVWQQLQEVYPNDADARKNIGMILGDLGRYPEAIVQLEAAMNDPDGWKLLVDLGMDYAHIGQKEKAIAAFDKALEHDSSSDSLNLVAYVLTGEKMMLAEALRYGERAVREREAETYHISLEHLTYEDLRTMPGLGGDWDTLGWTHFAMGHLELAQKYLEAAWNLFESATIGDHLGQLYEKQGNKTEAVQVYARAVAQKDVPPETMGRLVALLGSVALAEKAVEQAAASLHEMRSVKVDQIVRAGGKAEFFVLLQRGPKVIDVKFINGSEALRDAGSAIASAKFEALFPDEGPVQIVRRGLLICKPENGGCEFELIPPDGVQSTQ